MKAKTNLQKIVMDNSKKLKPITQIQKEWAINECLEKYAVICRKTTYCLECGHRWKENINLAHLLEFCTCANCNSKLKYNQNHRIDKESAYFTILSTKKGMQVVRMFLVTKYFKKKQKASATFDEVMQHWITTKGQMETLSKPVNNMSQYYDAWVYGELEPRTNTSNHQMRCNIGPYKVYPKRRVLPTIKRNGFKGYFHGFSPQFLFKSLLSCNLSETLFKTRQFALLKEFKYSPDRINRNWKSIRICLRHNYIVKDVTTWLDYLDLLRYFSKDIFNPRIICPENLDLVHNKLAMKKTKMEDEKRNKKYQEKYKQEKSRFFGLEFEDGIISIKVLESIEEFINEAQNLKHCVYSNAYFKKKDSLIMSAKINGIPLETIEISIPDLRIIQSRGLNNKASKYHSRIIDIVQKNMERIDRAIA